MTVSITSSGIALDGPLVAGEKVAVSVSGLALATEDKPTLALLARFPDALLASVELAEDAQTPGTWTGELDTATKQTALFFATARADERRDAALELVAGRASLARLTVPMANSALCPKPDGSPFASPVYVPVPGPPGQGGDPYDQAPEMDGEASAGTADEYARGDHRHPTDDTRQAVIEDLAAIRSGAAAGATAVQPAALSAYRTASAQDAIDGAQDTAIASKYTKPASGIPASDLASGVLPTALPNPQPLHVGAINYDGSTEGYAPTADTNGGFGIVTLESATNSTNADGYAATPLAVKTVADSVAGKADSASIAPAFSASSTYAVGDYCTHEGLLYKCTTAVSTAGAWNAANWTAVAVTDEMPAPITVDSAMSSSSTNPVQNKVVNNALSGKLGYADTPKTAITIGSRQNAIGISSVVAGRDCKAETTWSFAQGRETRVFYNYYGHAEGYGSSVKGEAAHAEGSWTNAAGYYSHSEGAGTYATGQTSHAEGDGSTAAGVSSHADGYRAVTAASGSGSSTTTPHNYAYAWQGVSTGGYYHSHGAGTYNVNPVGGAAGFYVGEQSLGFHVNALAIASTTTLAPETAVYRAALNADGTFPTITDTAIPTASAYFQFELELTVPSTVPSTITGPTGWTWMDGGNLPDPSDLSGGETIYIACRLDCTARTIVANCYDVR